MAKAVVISPQDNVATAITHIEPNTHVDLGEGKTVLVLDTINFGHKFALIDIANEAPINKYGEIIGEATMEIKAGQHVHVHNVVSRRGRGDLPTED